MVHNTRGFARETNSTITLSSSDAFFEGQWSATGSIANINQL